MSKEHTNAPSTMTDDTPEASAWRYAQAQVDADIEKLTHLTDDDKMFIAGLDKQELEPEEYAARLKSYFQSQDGSIATPTDV